MEQVSNKFDDEIPQKSGPRVRSTSSPISSFMGKKIKPESGRPARLDTSLNVTGGKSPGILIPFEDSTPTPVGTLLTTGTSISSEESEVDSNSIGPDGLPLAKAHSLKENSKRERSLSFGINRNQNKVTYKLTTLTTPSIFAITFAEFMNQDIDARKQRLILYQIYSAEVIRNNNGLSPRQKKEVRGKDSKSSFGKFNTFLKSKKKKPSLNGISC